MSISNFERVGKALELLKQGLYPFLEREMKTVYGEDWPSRVSSAKDDRPSAKGKLSKGAGMDVYAILSTMWDRWNEVFAKTLGHTERSIVSELKAARNQWAHQEAFNLDDTYRTLDSMCRLLDAVSAEEAQEIEKHKQEVLRLRFEDQAKKEERKASVAAIEGQPTQGYRPWREVITPHPDVASGRYQQAEFAADLWQVYQKEGADEYKKPKDFFQRTFLTEGLQELLSLALERITGTGGAPVVALQTNFGGGKTHSMLALYHMLSGASLQDLVGLESIFQKAKVTNLPKVHRAVIVGTKISPGQPQKKPDGTMVRTLWGEIAWQLGEKQGYALVKQADETGTNPGTALETLFKKYSPCLILVDEWVAYARGLHDDIVLPGGTFDTQCTFAQALTEAVKAVPKTFLVVSIPASDNEIGGQMGSLAKDKLQNAIGRVESPWRPANAEESFEIVKRRLFQPMDVALYPARDAVAKAFRQMYQGQPQEFPSECKEGDYEHRIKAAYPIHPELFDRLYNDWSTIDRFQRTRGVLRLMAAVIHTLWERQDASLLIMPAHVPIDDRNVRSELIRYLEDPWAPIIEKEVDGSNALPLQIDGDNPNFGRYSACRRVARTIYMGSAPTTHNPNKGLEDKQVKLGCVQPGEAVATFGDALRRLSDQATHLYQDGKRYWYSTQPTVTKLAKDRAEQLDVDRIHQEIRSRLKGEQGNRGDFVRVHSCPESEADIPDEMEARLVVLGPEYTHTGKDQNSKARQYATRCLEYRGSSPRNFKNTLVFLAPDQARSKDLEASVRQYLAWKSIDDDKASLELDGFRATQAKTKMTAADDTITARIPETYQWVLYPGQEPNSSEVQWNEIRMPGGQQESLAVRIAKKLRSEEVLLPAFAGTRLKMEIEKIPLWRGNHVSMKQLAEDFAKYLYLPRLTDPEAVLRLAVRDGVNNLNWKNETFAYADSWDEGKKRYLGLHAGWITGSGGIECSGLVVKSDVAGKQLSEDAKASASDGSHGKPEGAVGPDGVGVEGIPGEGGKTGVGGTPGKPGKTEGQPAKPKRFHATAVLDPDRVGRDAGKIAEAVIQHLSLAPGAQAEITLEINVSIPGGASEHLVRTVTENCRTLKVFGGNYGFESE